MFSSNIAIHVNEFWKLVPATSVVEVIALIRRVIKYVLKFRQLCS